MAAISRSKAVNATCTDLLKNNGRTLESEYHKISKHLANFIKEITLREGEESPNLTVLRTTQLEIDRRVEEFYSKHPHLRESKRR